MGDYNVRNSFPIEDLPDYKYWDEEPEKPPVLRRDRLVEEAVPEGGEGEDEMEPPVVEEKPKEPSMLRVVLHHCMTNGGLIVFLICYTCMGAAVFMRLEGPNEEAEYDKILEARRDERSQFLVKLKDITKLVNRGQITAEVFKNQTDANLRIYEDELGVVVAESNFEPSWTFYSSMFFATTVLSTVGYGNIAPVTVGGRVFCMVYAVFGIALLLLVLASIGTLLARGATLLYRRIHTWCKKRKRGKDETDVVAFQRDRRAQEVIDEGWKSSGEKGDDGSMHVVDLHGEGKNGESAGAARDREAPDIEVEEKAKEEEVQIPLTIVLIFAFLYIVFLAALLISWESQWDYFEAFYFSFITLTTIGFGDLVPLHQKNLLACTFFILLGMAIMSMCIALAQEMIIQKVSWLSKKIGVAFASHKAKSEE